MTISGGNGQPATQTEIDRAREEVDRAERALAEAQAGGAPPTALRLLLDRLTALLAELRRLRGRSV